MFSKTFSGGIHPPEYKKLTKSSAIVTMSPAKKIVLPLLQHTGAPCVPLVKPQEKVVCGQKIASSDKFISAHIHASISGIISKIEDFTHPVWGKYPAIFIENSGEGDFTPLSQLRDPNCLSTEELNKIIREAGIAGLGGAAFPAHVKLSPPKEKPIHTLILNGAECEPYLTCDERLMVENAGEIIRGLEIISRIIAPEKILIGIENNKSEAVSAMQNALEKSSLSNAKIVVIKTKYPQGGEKQLIKTLLGKEVPSCGLPFDIGCLVHNVGTALAIYEAVVLSKPLFERVITVSGKAIKKPSNLKVRIGTLLSDIADFCGGFVKNPEKIIMGGPMMGLSQFSMDTPVIKGTSGVLFLTKEELNLAESGPCLRCGRCIDICPVSIMPASIALAAENSRWDLAKEYSPLDCIECGACSYICPTRRDLVHLIKMAKLATAKTAK